MNCHLSGRYQKRFPIQAGRAYVSLKTYEKRDCNRFAACVFAALCRGDPMRFSAASAFAVYPLKGGMPTGRKPIVRQIQCIWSGRCKSDAYSSMAAAAAERVSSLSVREGISSSGQK